MKVRLLQGNQAGAVEDWTEAEARAAIATGWCEAVVPAAPPVVTAPAPAPPKGRATRPKAARRRKRP